MGARRRDTIMVPHPAGEVLEVLCDGERLAEWNPAFGSSSGPSAAVTGSRVRITVRGMPGVLTYEQVTSDRVRMGIRIPGLAETGQWWVEPVPGGTRVTHEFVQSGPLARLLEPATREVASLRVGRLSRRLESPHLRID